ncbi:MAG: hypothetical protein UT60_C0022G0001, partial [candidate division CPR2 bacterium GW2011_GWD2_39_7]
MNNKKDNKIKGNKGEALACEYIEREGYKVLERNFKNQLLYSLT